MFGSSVGAPAWRRDVTSTVVKDRVEEFLKEVLVDACGDAEQLGAFEQAIETVARLPFLARVVGVPVDVVRVIDAGDRRGLLAICRRMGDEHQVALLDVTPGPVTVETCLLIDAYRRWCGVDPANVEAPSLPATMSWAYRPLASTNLTLPSPLGLTPHGDWDPVEQYWGEPGDDRHPLVAQIIAAGPRLAFEMEQVIPGVAADEWDLDPVADAAELHRAGADRQATRILESLLAKDERCIDAWVHLANIAFDAKGPKAAVDLYDRAVAIGEQSLPTGFDGVLPWGLIDNRPFLRALHGLGLCAWRQRRWDDAGQIFLSQAWLEGAGTWDAPYCWDRVRARERWRRD